MSTLTLVIKLSWETLFKVVLPNTLFAALPLVDKINIQSSFWCKETTKHQKIWVNPLLPVNAIIWLNFLLKISIYSHRGGFPSVDFVCNSHLMGPSLREFVYILSLFRLVPCEVPFSCGRERFQENVGRISGRWLILFDGPSAPRATGTFNWNPARSTALLHPHKIAEEPSGSGCSAT